MSAVAVPGASSSRTPFRLLVRRATAVGCAAAVVGAAVAFPLGRLAMRLLAAANPGASGMVTDDGFVVGDISAGGSAQLLLAAVQISMLGGALYLLLRPLLVGPSWVRTSTLSIGVATCFAALLADPAGFDFTVLQPRWLPILLFWVLPLVHTALFVLLAERWLRADSWFLSAPDRVVAWTVPVWLLAGALLVVVLPLFLLALLVSRTWRRPPAGGVIGRSAARAALVAVFSLGLVDLVRDVQLLM